MPTAVVVDKPNVATAVVFVTPPGTTMVSQLPPVFQSPLVVPVQVALLPCALAEEGASVRLKPQAAATHAERRTRRRRSLYVRGFFDSSGRD